MAISILAVACRVRWKYYMFARQGTHKMAGCDVTSRNNGIVTLPTNQTLLRPWDTYKHGNAHAQAKGIRTYLICLFGSGESCILSTKQEQKTEYHAQHQISITMSYLANGYRSTRNTTG